MDSTATELRKGMIRIAGGAFLMGSEDFYPEEKPVRPAEVGDFWIDETPVTNRQFSEFVDQTGYVTFAERPADLSDYPGASPEMAQPGSSVFLPPSHFDGATGGAGTPAWWSYVFGADWRRPLGPGSDIRRKMDHPVVHIVAEDAEAYAAWAGKSLPTEAEWEYAARGGLEGRKYAWGDELHPGGRVMAKTWQGLFPYKNDARPGHERTSPVRGFPPNGYGLYDMIGNVWEWTSDWYVDGPPASSPCCGGGRQKASIAPGTRMPRRVLKGGSHLCAPNYCQRYRPAARWPQPIDTSTSHTGFRCVVRG